MFDESLKQNSNEAVVGINFAENYKSITQNEPHSAHYSQTLISIFISAVIIKITCSSLQFDQTMKSIDSLYECNFRATDRNH